MRRRDASQHAAAGGGGGGRAARAGLAGAAPGPSATRIVIGTILIYT